VTLESTELDLDKIGIHNQHNKNKIHQQSNIMQDDVGIGDQLNTNDSRPNPDALKSIYIWNGLKNQISRWFKIYLA
jgi:hypothetical protein